MSKVNLEPVRAHVEILQLVKRKEAELKELKENSRAFVEEAMGGGDEGELDGEVVITWKRYKKRQFQQAKFAEAKPELAEEYTELVEGSSFTVVK